MIKNLKIDNVDYTQYVSLPLTEQYALDESLDNAVLVLKYTKIDTIFKPYKKVVITYENNDQTTYYVAQDEITKIIGGNYYNHRITLIEETKILEKIVVDSNTITQPLLRDFSEASVDVYVEEKAVSIYPTTTNHYPNNHYKTIYNTDENLECLSAEEWDFAFYVNTVTGKSLKITHNGLTTTYGRYDTPTIALEEGIYTFQYIEDGADIIPDFAPVYYTITATFSIAVVNKETTTTYTITDVVNRLLRISETLEANELPRFTFNQDQATEYSTIISPEFAFTRGTLKECLDQVGGYIHGIPRLENDVIYFDKLGQMNEEKMPLNCIGEIKSQNIEQYCTNLDTHADNIINLENSKAGTITEPYINGFETVRAETGVVRITDESAIIETEYPIQKIEKLIIGYVKDNSSQLHHDIDITPYVYESAEYQALSSYDATFPYSKAYAIYFTQGRNNIYGLNFKLQHPISQIFTKYSIINILEQITQREFSNIASVQPFVQLNFQVVYYPVVSARVGQSKQDLREYDKKITSIYNQSANMVDSTAYGENLKGAVMRLGNVDIKKTYLFPSYDYIYPVGTLVDDDYYISTVEIGHYKNYIKCTYGLSKDFNRLSQYIGIKNNIRMYEISEKQAVDRYILSEDYMVFENKDDSIASASNKAFVSTANTIESLTKEIQGDGTYKRYPTVAICQPDVRNTKFALPVVSLGIGNSILYTFSFKDNYSAGNVADEGSDNNTFNVQTYAPYGDYFGRFENINIKLSFTAQIPTSQSTAINIGNALPIIDDNNGAYTPYEFTNVDLQVYKDNREKLIFNHQVHLVSRLDNFIISSNLATYSNLIGAESSSAWKLYILPNKINKFEKDIDLTGATLVSSDIATDYTLQTDTTNYNALWFENNAIATADGKSWAVVKEVNSENKLLFGRNIDIMETDEIELPKISLVHKIL